MATSEVTIKVETGELATILAALRYYQEEGMGEPEYRSDRIHTIATNNDCETSLSSEEIDGLCERINTSGVYDDDSGKPEAPRDTDDEDDEDDDLDDDSGSDDLGDPGDEEEEF